MARTTNSLHQFLVLADSGPDADYTTEPRHRIKLDLLFTPSGRSSAKQLRELSRVIRWELREFLPGSRTVTSQVSTGILVWLCDENGQPTLFVAGLLAVREGRATKAEAEALNCRLLPQVTCDQTVQEYRLLFSTSVQKWCEFDEPVGFSDELSERENEVLDELEGFFGEFMLSDSYEDDDGTLYVTAEGWKVVTVPLPFQPGPKATAAQLRYAQANAFDQILQAIPCGWEMNEDFGDEVWVLDEENEPVVYVTGLLDVREGRLSPRKLRDETDRSKSRLPSGTSLSEMAAA